MAKQSAAANDNENTPLLSNEDPALERDRPRASILRSVQHWLVENVVITVVAVLLLIGTIIVCVYGLSNHNESHPPPSPPSSNDICTSSGCVLAAATLIWSMSPRYKELDPCENFRMYACEGFDATHELREDQTSLGSIQLMAEELQLLLKRILDSPSPAGSLVSQDSSSADSEIFSKMQATYNACINETELKSLGSQPLLDLLLEIESIFPAEPLNSPEGSAPIMYSHQKGPSSRIEDPLSKAIEYLMGIGVDAMISSGVTADDRDPDANIIMLTAPYRIGLPAKEYYKDEKILADYKTTIGTVLEGLLRQAYPNSTVLSVLRNSQDMYTLNVSRIQSLVEFEANLAAASPDPEDAQDVTKYYNPRSLDETQALIPQISIGYLLRSRNSEIEPQKIIVGSPEYLTSLSKILKHERVETIQAYLVWKAVQSYGAYVEDEVLRPLLRFENKLAGKGPDVKEDRWRTCVKQVDSGLEWILSRFFIERAFSKEAKDFGDRIILDIKDEFSKKLENAEWMSEDVRKLAIDKVHQIRQKIGYPTKSPDITNSTALKRYYQDIKITDHTYFANRLSIVESKVAREWAKAGKPVDKEEWGMSAPTVNAYYNPPGNEIVFPAGIMQAPVFYDPSVPKFLSYGAFGSVAGHELSHAFDSSGRHYDQNGNYTEWWDNSTVEAFKGKADCFVEQYHNFTIPNKDGTPLHVNGRLTLGENIADAGGVTASFQAWLVRDREEPDSLLPGLQQFTKEQMFFLSYSNFWCGMIRPEQAINRIYTDPHSPPQYRIMGTMANSREFRKAFNCPRKEPTCELW